MKKSFQKSKIGIIPQDWNVGVFNDLVLTIKSGVSVNGNSFPAGEGEKGILKTSSVYMGRFLPNNNKVIVNENELKRVNVFPLSNTLIICRANSPEYVGMAAYVNSDFKDVFLSDKLWLIKCKDNVDCKWVNYLLTLNRYRYFIINRATGTSNSMKNISKSSYLSLPIPLPPLPEQKKIAKILSTWDEAIEQNQKLIEQLKLRKKGLMQQLLTGKKRLAGFDGEWEERKIGDYLNESKVLSSQNDPQKRLSVKLTLKGVEKRPVRGTESKDSTTFYVRKAGQFIYGKQNLHKGAMGIIPEELDGFESTQDLPTFDIKPDLNSKWFLYYMSRSNFYEKLENIATGTGSKRIHPKSLFKVKIFVPSFREQNAIVNILSTNDSEIELQEQKLASLQQQKKGLMQKLLTGQIRVSTND